MEKIKMEETSSWKVLRFKITTELLRDLAAVYQIDISDIPNNTRHKAEIATRLWTKVYALRY